MMWRQVRLCAPAQRLAFIYYLISPLIILTEKKVVQQHFINTQASLDRPLFMECDYWAEHSKRFSIFNVAVFWRICLLLRRWRRVCNFIVLTWSVGSVSQSQTDLWQEQWGETHTHIAPTSISWTREESSVFIFSLIFS